MANGTAPDRPTRLPRLRTIAIDAAGLATIPAVLVGIYLFVPTGLQEQLAFAYGDPTLGTAWTATLVHYNLEHLMANVVGYTLAIIPGYALYQYWGRRRLFWITIVVFLCAVPPLVATIDYFVWHKALAVVGTATTARGFSGVVFAFGGMLLAAVTLFLQDSYDRRLAVGVFVGIFLLGEGSLLLKTSGSLSSVAGGIWAVGIALVGYDIVPWHRCRQPQTLRVAVREHIIELYLVVSTALVVGVFMSGLVVMDPVRDTMVVNVVSHTAGFVVGLVGTGVVWEVVVQRTA